MSSRFDSFFIAELTYETDLEFFADGGTEMLAVYSLLFGVMLKPGSSGSSKSYSS